MLTPQSLLLLAAIDRCGSLTAAAAELGHSPSALSQQVAQLERQVGAPVLVRHARGVRPNAAGTALLRHAERIATALREAESEVADLVRGMAGTVEVGSFPSASKSFVAETMTSFLTDHPHVDVVLRDLEPSESLPLVQTRHLDAAVVFHYPTLAELLPVGAEVEPLFDDPLLLVLPAGHPLAALDEPRVADLAGLRWVHGHDWGAGSRLLQAICQGAGFEPRIGLESDSYDVQQVLVAAGLGAALIPELAIGRPDDSLAVRRIVDADPFRRISLVRAVGPPGRALAAFVADLKGHLPHARTWA